MSSTAPMNGSGNKSALLILGAWICLAAGAGLGGWLESANAPVVAGIVWTLTALALGACWKVARLRRWAMKIDLRWLVLLHLTRDRGIHQLVAEGAAAAAAAAESGQRGQPARPLALVIAVCVGADL